MLAPLSGRQCEFERASFACSGFEPDSSAVTLNDTPAGRQSNPGSRYLALLMQSREHFKYPVVIRRVDANTVVLDGNDLFIAGFRR